jgi:hypothetical protein
VRQKCPKSDAPQFTNEEKLRLIDYFLADCSEGKDSKAGYIVSELERNYPAYVERFVANLNKKARGYRIPRKVVRRLWEAGCLRRCQLLPAFTYAYFCIKRSGFEADFRSWLKQVESTVRATKKVLRAHKQLEKTIHRQANRADASFVGPGAKSPQLITVGLATDCILGTDEMERIQSGGAGLRVRMSQLSSLCCMAREQALGVDHPEHPAASAPDLAHILPLLGVCRA